MKSGLIGKTDDKLMQIITKSGVIEKVGDEVIGIIDGEEPCNFMYNHIWSSWKCG